MIKYELTQKEKGIILGIVLNTRNDYLKKNKYSKIKYIELKNINVLISDETFDDVIQNKCNTIMSASELGNLFTDPKLKKIIEMALTDKQRSVLFLYYCKNKKDKEISQILNLKEDTVRKIRNRTLEKIRKMI